MMRPTQPRRVARGICLGRLIVVAVGAALALPSPAVASSPECPNEPRRAESNIDPSTGHPYSTELPDCRAYELVSNEKDDHDAMLSPLITNHHSGFGGFGLVADIGERLTWEAPGAWPYGEPSNGVKDVRQSVLNERAWTQSSVAPPGINGTRAFEIAAASSDLSFVVLRARPFEEAAGEGLLESGPGGCCATIASGLAAPNGRDIGKPFAHISPDGHHVFFQTQAPALEEEEHPEAEPPHEEGSQQLYEWTASGGLRLAGVETDGEPTSPCGAALAGGIVSYASDVSSNGSRVFFASPDPGMEASSTPPTNCRRGPVVEGRPRYVSDLYLRQNGSSTVEISKPPAGAADYGASFVGETPDGSKAFFVSETALTPDKAGNGADLYEYDSETGVLRRLSVGTEEADLTAFGERLGQAAIVSADGSHVYFTALGRLVPGAGRTLAENSGARTANLYLFARGRVTFIATVEHAEVKEDAGELGALGTPLRASHAAVTPDGSVLVFDSNSRLTAYDNEGRPELYRYDEAAATISCVSCSPTGLRPNGGNPTVFRTSFEEEPLAAAEQFGGLSEDGSTIFFASVDRLLPAALNAAEPDAENPVYDVYEWRDGVLSLISTGTSASSDFLIGASPSGSDVFFLTGEQLVSQDGDSAYDIYDARAGGGFAAPATPAPCTSADTCRAMIATPPVAVAPASIGFSGPGNAAAVAEGPAPSAGGASNPLTRAQKLARALRECARVPKRKRAACRRRAAKRYGPGSRGAAATPLRSRR
jgi:hypothetical protein